MGKRKLEASRHDVLRCTWSGHDCWRPRERIWTSCTSKAWSRSLSCRNRCRLHGASAAAGAQWQSARGQTVRTDALNCNRRPLLIRLVVLGSSVHASFPGGIGILSNNQTSQPSTIIQLVFETSEYLIGPGEWDGARFVRHETGEEGTRWRLFTPETGALFSLPTSSHDQPNPSPRPS
jgi:hypothetical protein